MLDEKSNSRFWDVKVVIMGGSEDAFIMQSCPTKGAEYIEKILTELHPEYTEINVVATGRPDFIGRAYGDPE